MSGPVVVLTGGVGGAKLVEGLHAAADPSSVIAIVNTGDDFVHLGLSISPDIDTLLYTLSGQSNPELGWGRAEETWNFMAALRSLGGETWFQLGDGDLALHVLRTYRLRQGQPLSRITADFAAAWGIRCEVLPMTDDKVSTEIETQEEGTLTFQQYFVAKACRPAARSIRFSGCDKAVPAPGVLKALLNPQNRAIVIAPSNPFLSIDPILSVPEIRHALEHSPAPVIAVSPLVGGTAVKGPTAKLMMELDLPVSASTVAKHYASFLNGIIIDARDPPQALSVPSVRTDILMNSVNDKKRVATVALELAASL